MTQEEQGSEQPCTCKPFKIFKLGETSYLDLIISINFANKTHHGILHDGWDDSIEQVVKNLCGEDLFLRDCMCIVLRWK
jgi:hypothetical protein